ncbi:histidine kinase [Asanoa ferruginea]|uniref:Histidine kinase n=1 Tax=Asanoa ferruginea TaxID=53367 RepID=A0A3D9ZHI2_9ACTN|nr:histidine kinase [Asanoa ferruginea]REF95974.1 histidine kinase [Asanoa ferruginea]GIF48165.1 hypothetical protein Afe04nite_27040 [Asanoa ferruginea]
MGKRVAWGACLATVAVVVGAVVLGAVNGTDPRTRAYLVFVLTCAVAGALVAGGRRSLLGWLLLGSASAFALVELAGEYAVYGAVPYPLLAAWVTTWLWVPANLCAALVPLFFPDGRLPDRRWWWLLGPLLAVAATAAVLSALRPGTPDQLAGHPGITNPFGVPGLSVTAVDRAFTLLAGLTFAAGAVAVVLRARAAGEVRRRQLVWVAWAVAVAATVVAARLVAGLTDADAGSPWPRGSLFWEYAGAAALSLVPAAVTVAVLRHRLYDVDLLVNRTLLYAALSTFLVGGYVLIAGYLGAVVGRSGSLSVSVVAAAAVAVGFAPLRARVQSGIDRLSYGRRKDPYAVLAGLGRRLEEAVSPAAVLPAIAQTVADTLRLRYVAVEVAGGATVASGVAEGPPTRLPLTFQGEDVGALAVWPAPTTRRRGGDQRLLADLARHVGVAVHAARETERAVRLSADLQRSRERLVMAREEERRRLRRDLHDGLGPTLAALTMRAEAAQDVAGDEAKPLLTLIADDARAAIGDVRRLVDGLRPAALDTLGLVGALRSHLAALPPGDTLVTLDARASLPALPAATEVAAYRIAVEAVTNARRHAGAARATVSLALAGSRLVLEIRDDGTGAITERPGGVGLPSMRERAAEVGGTLRVEGGAGGSLVRADLPATTED